MAGFPEPKGMAAAPVDRVIQVAVGRFDSMVPPHLAKPFLVPPL
jgi:hypothetical protein